MLFPSPVFLFIFLPFVLVFYHFTPLKFKNHMLLVASLFFYAWGETIYVLLMLASTLINYVLGLAIEKKWCGIQKKGWLTIGVFFNLSLLVVFKYANFLVDNINVPLQWLSLPPFTIDTIHLPLGISFFTFQAMSYIIDVYRGEVPAQQRFSNIALYIALFPQLIAGPIVRYHDVAQQISFRTVDSMLFVSGMRRFVLGLSKKMLLANPLGLIADSVFGLPNTEMGFALAWLGIICYALQIYFDFSAYSDMAIGLGRMFGFRFLENFNYPYIAQSLQDFWRRWHISLSRWFRDYLYIPLGGNRKGRSRTYFNLFAVFLLCGLWHGASWNFVIWGMIHGVFLVLERAGLGRLLMHVSRPVRHLYTLTVVCVAWVFFRSDELPSALDYLRSMFALGNGVPIEGRFSALAFQPDVTLALFAGLLFSTPIYPWLSKKVLIPWQTSRLGMYFVVQLVSIYSLLMISVLAVSSTTYNPFIYFRF